MARQEFDPFNPTDEQTTQFILQYGDENGHVDEVTFTDFLSGNLELDLPTDSDTAEDADDDQLDSQEETAQVSEEEEKEEVAAAADAGSDAEDQQAESDDDDDADGDSETKVLAKDGKHTIPYSVVEELRTDLSALKEQNDELKKLLDSNKGVEGKIDDAQQPDAEAGTTEATDALLDDLEEDYPGISEKLKQILLQPLQAQIAELRADKVQRDDATAKDMAQAEYNQKAQDLDERYGDTITDDNFWKWFDKQPSIIRQAETSGDPQHFVDAMALYYKEQPAESAEKQDKPAAKKVDAAAVEKRVRTATEKASKASTVNTLTDLPGGKNPEHDEVEALSKMSSIELANRLLALGDPSAIEAKIAKLV